MGYLHFARDSKFAGLARRGSVVHRCNAALYHLYTYFFLALCGLGLIVTAQMKC